MSTDEPPAVNGNGLLERLRAEVENVTDASVPTQPPLTRVRLRTILGLIALGFAVHILLPQVGELRHTLDVIASAGVGWLGVALALSALRYPMAALALVGATREPLGLARTTLVQVAGSFAGQLAPGVIGVFGLKERYLERSGLSRPEAFAALGLEAAAGVIVHALVLATVVSVIGEAVLSTVRAPRGWPVLLAVAATALLATLLAGVPWARRRIVRPVLEAVRGLGPVLAQPRQAAALLSGTAGLTLAFVLALAASLQAYSAHASVTLVALVYLVGAAVGSVAPTPGGLGVKEATWVAALTALGVASGPAVAGVLTFRLVTFWLPLAPGALVLRHLHRRDVI